jgi:hypothetical protein
LGLIFLAILLFCAIFASIESPSGTVKPGKQGKLCEDSGEIVAFITAFVGWTTT